MAMRKLLQVTLLVILSLSAWWLWRAEPEPTTPDETAPAAEQPRQFIDRLHAHHMDEQGAVRFELEATGMEYFADQGHAAFNDVDLLYFPPGHPPWHLEARRARVPDAGDEVFLEGDVVVHLRFEPPAPEMVVRTPALQVHLHDQQARSRDGVMITRGNSRAQARLMLADMATGSVTLEQNVRSTYEPEAP